MTDTIEEKKGRIRTLPDLPPLPHIAQMVLEEVSKEDVNINQLSRVIERDPGLLARIIGIANSAFYGCPDKIYTVADAIIKVLGLNLVKSLALGIVLNGPLSTARCKGFQLDQYWFASMHTAFLAKQLSATIAWEDEGVKDHIYLCGLLHNLGLLVLVYCFPKQMEEVFVLAGEDEGRDLFAIERDILGITHAEAGGLLARKWNLPADVARVMEHHHDDGYRGEFWQLSALVGLSMHVAMLDCDEIEGNTEVSRYLLSLGLDVARVGAVCEQVMAKKQEIIGLACVLSLD